MEVIETSVLQYLEHIQDIDYLAAIVTSTSSLRLCDTINRLLQSKNDEIIDSTCLFIRDLVLFGSRHPECKEFVEGFARSSIVNTLEDLLFSANHFTRKQAVYTLGKTCSYSSADALNQAFAHFETLIQFYYQG